MQWAINAYLLSLASFFAFGGRLADTVGHKKMVVLGVIVFAGSSALCGLTPAGGAAEAWIVIFRLTQGIGGAFMFPAACWPSWSRHLTCINGVGLWPCSSASPAA